MRFRDKRGGGGPKPDAKKDPNTSHVEDDSRPIDVHALVDQFMIDPEAADATRRWTPSRRGNSPHHGS